MAYSVSFKFTLVSVFQVRCLITLGFCSYQGGTLDCLKSTMDLTLGQLAELPRHGVSDIFWGALVRFSGEGSSILLSGRYLSLMVYVMGEGLISLYSIWKHSFNPIFQCHTAYSQLWLMCPGPQTLCTVTRK